MSLLPPLTPLASASPSLSPPLTPLASLPLPDPTSTSSTSLAPIPPGTPILASLPSAQAAFTKKYTDSNLQQALSQIPTSLRQSLIDFDQQRVNRGQQPLSSAQTLAALQTVQTNQQATPQPSEGFFNNAVADIGTIVSSIPQLPFNLYNEFQQLPQAPAKLSEALNAGSVGGVLQGLTQTPGVRMIPGVNTLSNLVNDPGELLHHPVITALDVLPYAAPATSSLAETAFSKLPGVIAARDAADLDALNASRLEAGLQPVDPPSAARLAIGQSPITQSLANSPIGQTFSKLFGTNARDLAQMNYSTASRYQLMGDPNSPIPITPDIQILRDAKTAAAQWSDQIPEARRTELTDAMALNRDIINDPTLTDAERAFVTENVYHNDQIANYGIRQGLLGNVDGEIFTSTEANRIQNSRTQLARYTQLSDARNLLAQSSPQTLDATIQSIDPSSFLSESLSRPKQITLAQSYAHALDAVGVDTTDIQTAIKTLKSDRSAPVSALSPMFSDTLANPSLIPTLTPTDISAQLQPYAGRLSSGDPLTAQVRALIDNGEYQAAVEKLRTINQRSTYVIPNADQMLDSLIRIRDRQKFLDSTSQFNDRTVTRLAKSNAALESQIVPARFTPLIEQTVHNKLLDMYASDTSAQQLIHDHLYTQLPDLGQDGLNKLYREAAKGWQDLKANGYDPVFVHRVSPSSVPSLGRVTLSDTLRTPDSVKARTFDATPYVHDAAVAMTDQAMGYLRQQAIREYTDHIQSLYGVSGTDLASRYLDQARQANEIQPGLGVDAHLQNLMQRSHVPFDPAAIFSGKGSLGTISGPDQLYIPKAVDGVLRQMFHDYNQNTISKLFDPIMRTFRTALIPLSPRSFMHHFVGAGVMLAGESDPGVFFRQLSAARDLVNSGELAAIKGMPPSGLGDAPADIVEWGKKATKTDQLVAAHQFAAGNWIRQNLWDRIAPARNAAGGLIDNIYKFRNHMDEMYRGVAYLEGRDKALTAGMDPAQAEQAGIGLVRKTMQSWDRMTPMERQTIRMVFPFYGYMSHVLKYAFRYPMDHPFRVGVLDNFARNESNDFGTALPTRFMESLFLGNPDSKGNVNTLQLQSFNPFRDVANYFTLAGFTGASNPVIQAVIKAMGVDPRKGAPSLYPDIAYDPVTGQLRPDNPNLLSSFVSDVIPQTQILTAMLGRNDQFKQVLSSNPDAAAALLRTAAGLPNLFRTINPAQEAFKAEIQRETNQTNVKNEALRTGDYSTANTFPGLRAYFQQITQLMGKSPQVFQPYVPQPQPGSSVTDALTGLVRNNIP